MDRERIEVRHPRPREKVKKTCAGESTLERMERKAARENKEG